jgi:mannosyl-3-phosphoglycerate phosphatase family protein
MTLPALVVFSDLDGCLLDRETYAHEPARPALALLRRRGIPLVLCSSKTQAEVEYYRAILGLRDPFIVENGGAVLIPAGYVPSARTPTGGGGPYFTAELGIPYARVSESLREIRRATGLGLFGFGDMSVQEVALLTGLEPAAARRAMARRYDEPFIAALRADQLQRLEAEVCRRGLRLTRGGRLYHLSGRHTKGLGVDLLARIYRSRSPKLMTVGLGDGANDLAMLERVDIPVVIPRAPSRVDPALAGRPWRVAPAPGPAGWGAALLDLLAQHGAPVGRP